MAGPPWLLSILPPEHSARGSDEDKDDKSSRVNAKSGVMGRRSKIEACDEFCLHGEGQNKIANSKLSIMQASKAAKDYRKKAYKSVSDAIVSLPYAIGSPNSPTGLQMGTKGKHKAPSIRSGNKIDEYLRTGRIKVFEAEYGIDFDGPEVEDVAILRKKKRETIQGDLNTRKRLAKKYFLLMA